MKKIVIDDLDDLKRGAEEFVKLTRGHHLFAMQGEMGAGKTTLIKEICALLGSADTVTSPTFTLVNEYRTGEGEPIFHFDFYRIRKTEEIYDFGFEEYISSGHACYMEWPELVSDALPEEVVKVVITVNEDTSRTITIDL